MAKYMYEGCGVGCARASNSVVTRAGRLPGSFPGHPTGKTDPSKIWSYALGGDDTAHPALARESG